MDTPRGQAIYAAGVMALAVALNFVLLLIFHSTVG